MSSSSSTSLSMSCDGTFISSDSQVPEASSCLDKCDDLSFSFSQIFPPKRKTRACSVPHIAPSLGTDPDGENLSHLEFSDVNSRRSLDAKDSFSKNMMAASLSDIRTQGNNKTIFSATTSSTRLTGLDPKFRRSSYSLTLDDHTIDDNSTFLANRSSIKKLFQAPSPRINQLKQEEGMERETTHERSTHINLQLSNTWEDLALDCLNKPVTKVTKELGYTENGSEGFTFGKIGTNSHTWDSSPIHNAANGNGLMSPHSFTSRSHSYSTFRAISSPTGKCYGSRRSLSPVIVLKPSSINIKRKYDSDNDSCASSPPTKKQSSTTLDQRDTLPTLFLQSPPNQRPQHQQLHHSSNCSISSSTCHAGFGTFVAFDNRSLPPSPGQLFDFGTAGTSRSSSPCFSEESSRGTTSRVEAVDCEPSTTTWPPIMPRMMGSGEGRTQPPLSLPFAGFPYTPKPNARSSHYNKGGGKILHNSLMRPGMSLNNIDCLEKGGSSTFYHHSLRAKSLISPLSFRCFPSRSDFGPTPKALSTPGSVDESSPFFEEGTPSWCGTPDSSDNNYEASRRPGPSGSAPHNSPSTPETVSCPFGAVEPSYSPTPISAHHYRDVGGHVKATRSTFAPVERHPIGGYYGGVLRSPPDPLIDIKSIEATAHLDTCCTNGASPQETLMDVDVATAPSYYTNSPMTESFNLPSVCNSTPWLPDSQNLLLQSSRGHTEYTLGGVVAPVTAPLTSR